MGFHRGKDPAEPVHAVRIIIQVNSARCMRKFI
jgi:hypothetical protein